MQDLVLEAEKYATSLLRSKLPYHFTYHNLSHTLRVVESIKELIIGENIPEADAENLLIAGWLHDVGYIIDINTHEDHSKDISAEFLAKNHLDTNKIDIISNLILATKMGHEPQNLLEKIMRDADFSHLKSKDFTDINTLLRNEWETTCNRHYDELQWINENILFLTKHHQFHTNYAINHWERGKEKNLALLFKTKKKQEGNTKKDSEKSEQFSLKKKKAISPERGIETMFRTTLRNHITLSNIADTKANILLSVNAIIVSLVLSNLIPKLDNPTNHYLIYPTILFVLFTVTTMILSVLATRPNVTSGKFTKEDVDNKKVNLLFFGNFHKMSLEDFEWAMGEMMKDGDYLYSSMKKDLYFLGLVLNRKYKILRTTYTVFIIGIVLSVIAFSLAFKYMGR
jgi:predicted metal-dependent HD superfamily phosphohydrolase